jgi:hypothetical protein
MDHHHRHRRHRACRVAGGTPLMCTTIEGVTFNGGDAWDHVTFRGVTLEKRTVAFILRVEADLGHKLAIVQGSYHPGVSQSGGTHDKGGVFDCWDVFGPEPLTVQHKLREHGGFAWYRPAIPGLWERHIHCGVLGDTDMSPQLAAQVPDYRNYKDGLASHAADSTWHPFAEGNDPKPSFDYPAWLRRQDVNFDDVIPATDNKTVGDALREGLRGDEHAAAIQANVNDLQAHVNDRLDKTDASLLEAKQEIKNLGADIDALTALVKAL